MSKKILLILFILSAVPALSESIEGRILLKTAETGTLYIMLANEADFSVPFSGTKGLIIDVGEPELKAGSVEYSFDGVEQGVYAIRCFLDTDGDEKLKIGLTGPKEPWGMSWNRKRLFGPPKFEDVSFSATGELSEIDITLE